MISEDLRNLARQFSKIDTEDSTVVVDSIWLKTMSCIIDDLADQTEELEGRVVPGNARHVPGDENGNVVVFNQHQVRNGGA